MKFKRRLLVATSVSVAFATGGWASGVWSTAATPALGSDNITSDCIGLVIPTNAVTDSYLDPANGTLSLTWFDEQVGGDRSETVNYTAAACTINPSVGVEIARALDFLSRRTADECTWMTDFLASGETTVRGQAVDREAGERFVARGCVPTFDK